MSNQINEKSKTSYKQDSSTNAVKLLSRVSNFNGYIKIYTELNSNFKEGDNVYISSKFNIKYTGFTLDNYIENSLDDYPYTKYANGYKILKVKNNEIVIDRLYDADSIGVLEDHYISKISFNSGTFDKGELNSVLFKQVEMSPDSMADIIFNQAIALSGTVSDTLILDKYDYHYISQNTAIGNGPPIVTYSFNNTYGYSYFENVTFIECSFQNGYYKDCLLDILIWSVNPYHIENGYYDTCVINNHTLNNGYIKDCDLDPSCVWNGGTWNNLVGVDFGPAVWNDGIWINGIFFNKTWYDGEFKGGTFSASTWYDGTFNGVANNYYNMILKGQNNVTSSNFFKSLWYDGIFNGGTFSYSNWVKGTFNNGYISDSSWSGGTFNNGNLKTTDWVKGTFNGGNFGIDDSSLSEWYRGHFNNGNIKANWNGGYFNGGLMRDSTWVTGTFTNGTFYNSTWTDGIWFDGTFNQATWLNGLWHNGLIEDTDIDGIGLITASNWYNGDWENGKANSGIFHNINWSGGTANNVQMGGEESVINWYGGSFNGTKFGWAEQEITHNSIPMAWAGGGSVYPQPTPPRYFTKGELSGSTAWDAYQTLSIRLAHDGEAGIVVFTDKSYVCTNIKIEWISPDTMTFQGEIGIANFDNFDVNFGPIRTGFTGNWYGGDLYGGVFYGKWYDGHYYNSTWYGQNLISSDYVEPTQYAGQGNVSIYNNFNENFIEQQTNIPPETNNFNPQNQSFQDPTFYN